MIRIILATSFLLLGCSLLALRALGLTNFQRFANSLFDFAILSSWFYKSIFKRFRKPLIIFSIFWGISLPYIILLLNFFNIMIIPSWTITYASLLMTIGVMNPDKSVIFWAVLSYPIYLGTRKLKKYRNTAFFVGLAILFSILILLVPEVGLGVVLTIIGITLPAIAITAIMVCCLTIFLLITGPIKLISIVSEHLAYRNLERLAAILGIILTVLSSLIYAGIF